MKLAVIGNGTMGRGIAMCAALHNMEVTIKGRSRESLALCMKRINNTFNRFVEKRKMDQSAATGYLQKIKTTLDFADISDADILIEAVSENIEEKKKLLENLDGIAKPNAVIATNTSSLSITELASATSQPERVIGLHFFNPVVNMELVEVISGARTSGEVLMKVFSFCEALEKRPVKAEEAPGFIVNRLLIPMINEAIAEYADGVASIEAIDTAMKLGANHPMGPLELADFIGLDVCLAIMETLQAEFGENKYRPHPLLRKMVRANMYGRKSGRGFYEYPEN